MGNAAGFSRPHRALFAVTLLATLAAAPGATFAATECPPVGDVIFDQTSRAFTQTRTLPSLPSPISSAGVLQAREGAFVWQICTPFDIRTVIDEQGIRQSVEGGPETSPGPAIVQDTIRRISIADIFRGRFKDLETAFATEMGRTDEGEWLVTLTPHDQAIAAVIGRIDVVGCQAIEAVNIDYRDGGRDAIIVEEALPQNPSAACQSD